MGKFAVIVLLATALAAGGGIWYTSQTAFWAPMEGVEITAVLAAGEMREPIVAENVQAIRSESSPLGFRACFTSPTSTTTLAETYVMMDGAAPTVPPSSFDCFDASALGAELEAGTAIAVLGHKNIAYGVDRIVAVTDDGRGYAWHELNNCGRKAYDGSPVGEVCPDRDGFVATFKGEF